MGQDLNRIKDCWMGKNKFKCHKIYTKLHHLAVKSHLYMTHSTYKGPYPFQTGPMQNFDRILISMDPIHVLLTVI